MKFIIHRQGNQKGPLSSDEILKQVKNRELDWTDYIFDEQKKDWVFLLNHPKFTELFQKSSPAPDIKAPELSEKSKTDIQMAHKGNPDLEWFILREDNKFGPFTYVELVKMLQQKKLFEYDYVWNRHEMSSWKHIAEIEHFRPEKIKALKEEGAHELKDVFYRRRHARVKYGASILLHNNKEVWRGHSMELSSGGAGLVIETNEIREGDTLFLHFKAGDGVPPFNAVCKIVSKQAGKGAAYRYGVKFTSISQVIQKAIKKFTNEAA